jgi:hypothetical protein
MKKREIMTTNQIHYAGEDFTNKWAKSINSNTCTLQIFLTVRKEKQFQHCQVYDESKEKMAT